ncbi:ACP S-malonyltransferase [Kamptonema cortianum]|nr:ACP S-malonyltransferase [Geitlerinema splendidum]MDK3156915.1 ACP S-malonyltransferase [Kamptonema cortianum]
MIAVVFPGQGSQRPGMGEDLYHNDSFARQVFDQVEQATGLNMVGLCFNSDEETLRQTQNTQIALYTTGLAAWYALKAAVPGLIPAATAGHSVGEYAALAAAGVISIEEGARLVRRRGEIMANAGSSRPGSMAAVLGLEKDELKRMLASVQSSGTVVVANDNCPGQVVISGDVDAVHAASAAASEFGAKRVIPLNVSGAFHSPLMESSAAELSTDLKAAHFSGGKCPVYSNVTASPGENWSDLLEQQLKSPVRWTESVQAMVNDGITTFIECGSGEVLTSFLRRISKESTGLKVVDMVTLEETAAKLKELK